MSNDDDDLTDAQSREANRRYRDLAERQKSADPSFAYMLRWVPTGNWRMSGFDALVIGTGVALILMILGMRLFGVIG